MNRKGKSWPLFVVAILIVLFSLTAILGVSYTYGDTKNVYVKGASDIRFGIDSAAAWMSHSCLPGMWMPPMSR